MAHLFILITKSHTLKIKNMSNPNKIILGLLGAAAAGVVIGILLAPEKSNEIRKKIADKASDIALKIGEMISSGKDKVEEVEKNLA